MNAIIGFPFAFGGNPATESGSKAIFDSLKNDNIQRTDYIMLKQSLQKSAEEYLRDCKIQMEQILKKYNKCCIVGGNHLSILPVYNAIVSSKNNANIVTLDAHRDYYPEAELNHATFLKHIVKGNYKIHLVGSRDSHSHNESNEFVQLYSYADFLQKTVNSIDFLDIDVDAFDEDWFPYYCSYLPNGLLYKEIINIVDYVKIRGCKCLAVSEYMPYYDSQLNGLEYIKTIINRFLLS